MNWGKTSQGNPSLRPMFASAKKQVSLYNSSGTETAYNFSEGVSTNTDYSIVIKRQGTSVFVKIDNTTYVNDTVSYASEFDYLALVAYGASRTATLTDLKVKPL